VAMIAVLTATNICGLRYGKIVQNLFTVTKTGALLGLIGVGLVLGWNAEAVRENFGDLWTIRNSTDLGGGLTAASAFGLFVALCVAQTGSLFSSDTWNNVTFTAGEVRQPRRNLPLSLALGTSFVIAVYLLANLAYLVTLPFADIQREPAPPVATVMMERIFPQGGVALMAAAIMVSTFGCNNGLILAGARAYYAMARDGLFFQSAGRLNAARVPAWGLVLQGVWAALLVLPRTYDVREHKYGNLYNDLLDYIISAALLFYVLTIAGVYRLRATRPHAERPYRAFGYPVVPALYLVGAATIVSMLVRYRPMTTWPGMVIVLLGLPVYYIWKWRR
jgi:basic amino acid/polyamine antiporter, APA family